MSKKVIFFNAYFAVGFYEANTHDSQYDIIQA